MGREGCSTERAPVTAPDTAVEQAVAAAICPHNDKPCSWCLRTAGVAVAAVREHDADHRDGCSALGGGLCNCHAHDELAKAWLA